MGGSAWEVRRGRFGVGSAAWDVRRGMFGVGGGRFGVGGSVREVRREKWEVRRGRFGVGGSAWVFQGHGFPGTWLQFVLLRACLAGLPCGGRAKQASVSMAENPDQVNSTEAKRVMRAVRAVVATHSVYEKSLASWDVHTHAGGSKSRDELQKAKEKG